MRLAKCGNLLLLLIFFTSGTLNAEWSRHVIDKSSAGADGVKIGDINKDGLPDIVSGWEEGGLTKLYLHPGSTKVKEPWPAVVIGKTPSVEDAVFIDLNQDGRLDVVSSCEGETKKIFVHWAPEQSDLLNSKAWQQELLPESEGKMQWMYAQPMDVNKDGNIDIIAAGKNENAAVGWFRGNGSRQLSTITWHPISPAGWMMSIIPHDMDGDGDLDIMLSDRYGEHTGCRWLENPNDKTELKKSWKSHLAGSGHNENMFLTVDDFDQDGRTDILVAAKTRQILWLRRTSIHSWETYKLLFPDNTGTAKAVVVGDLNRDGINDCVISCEHASPPASGVFALYSVVNPCEKQWHSKDISGPDGIKFDRIELLDLDNDGDLDILTCEERHQNRGLGVIWYENPTSMH